MIFTFQNTVTLNLKTDWQIQRAGLKQTHGKESKTQIYIATIPQEDRGIRFK